MRHALWISTLVVTALVLSGCPWDLGDLDFTSADIGGYRGIGDMAEGPGGTLEDAAEPANSQATREVVEPDVIRQDGRLLYVLNQYRGLSIVDLEDLELMAQIPTYGFPRDLYLVDDRAYVLVGNAQNYTRDGNKVSIDLGARVYVLDVGEPEEASVLAHYDLEGDLLDSRLVGDVLYAVTGEYTWYWESDDGVAVASTAKHQGSSSWVTSLNVADPQDIQLKDEVAIGGYGDIIQATSEAVFVAGYDYESEGTLITYIDIADPAGAIDVRGHVQVPGEVADRFKLDAYQGVLRVVSSTWWPDRNVYVSTVDLADPDDLDVLGRTKVEGAAGETLFATRFDGDRGYVVTYFMIDPLFVLDLSDPTDPKVAGELEVPGWSTHIEPQGDRLIAMGVDDTKGQRVSVSIFDVADPADPQLLDRESFGSDWSWSSAYEDVKAFTVLDDVMIVPFSGWEESGGYNRLQFLSYTRDAISLRGHVDLQGNILRSFEHGDALYYGVTTEQVVEIDGANLYEPETTESLSLAEYVLDYFELDSRYTAEVVWSAEKREAVVYVTGPSGVSHSVTVRGIEQAGQTYLHDDMIVVVGTAWDDRGYYDLAFVDCARRTDPQLAERMDVDIEPFWGGWYGPEYDDMVFDKQMMPCCHWQPVDPGLMAGDYLVLRGYTANATVSLGDEDSNEVLALVNLAEQSWEATVSLGYEEVVSVAAAGDKICLATKESLSAFLRDPECAYFVRLLDPATREVGDAANVPGELVQYDPETELLLLRDVQYGGRNYELDYSLESVRWDGADSVRPLDSLTLEDFSGGALARGDWFYYEGYDDTPLLGAVTIDKDGRLEEAGTVSFGESTWPRLIDAKDEHAIVALGERLLVRYDFGGTPSIGHITETMGAPLHIRFGTNAAYAPLGYAGVAQLPL